MRRPGWAILVKLGIVAAILVLAWRFHEQVGWAALRQRASSAQPYYLMLAVFSLTARGLVMSLRWCRCLALLGRPFSRLQALAAQLAGIAINHLTPSARLLGGVFRARYFSQRYTVPFADAYATVLLDQASQQMIQGLLTWLALAGLAWVVGARGLAIGFAAAWMALLAGLLVWVRQRPQGTDRPLVLLAWRWMERRSRRLGPLWAGGRRVADLFGASIGDLYLQTRLSLLGLAVLATSAAAQWLVFRSLGTEVGILEVVAVVTIGAAAGVVTGTPGGIATTEAAMIAAFVALGVPEVEAAAATLVFRGLHYLVVLALGLPALIYCEMSSNKRVRSGDLPAPTALPDDQPPET